jgi:hypothetical protein
MQILMNVWAILFWDPVLGGGVTERDSSIEVQGDLITPPHRKHQPIGIHQTTAYLTNQHVKRKIEHHNHEEQTMNVDCNNRRNQKRLVGRGAILNATTS